MSDACTLPRTVHAAEVKIADRLHDAIRGMDVDGCNALSIVMPMNEYEKAGGPFFEMWPPAIQVRMNKEVERFSKERPKAKIVAVTQGVGDNCCVLALHWKEGK